MVAAFAHLNVLISGLEICNLNVNFIYNQLSIDYTMWKLRFSMLPSVVEKENEFKELLEKERQARLKAEESVEHKTEQLRLKEVQHEDMLNQYRQQFADLSCLLKKVHFSVYCLNQALLHCLWLFFDLTALCFTGLNVILREYYKLTSAQESFLWLKLFMAVFISHELAVFHEQ
jgi:hypothetical protein